MGRASLVAHRGSFAAQQPVKNDVHGSGEGREGRNGRRSFTVDGLQAYQENCLPSRSTNVSPRPALQCSHRAGGLEQSLML